MLYLLLVLKHWWTVSFVVCYNTCISNGTDLRPIKHVHPSTLVMIQWKYKDVFIAPLLPRRKGGYWPWMLVADVNWANVGFSVYFLVWNVWNMLECFHGRVPQRAQETQSPCRCRCLHYRVLAGSAYDHRGKWGFIVLVTFKKGDLN